MSFYKIFIVALLLTSVLALSAVAGEAPQYVFKIPVYPGTEPFDSYGLSLQSFRYPMATVTRVYRTKDHSPLDQTKVMAFFQDALAKKGWTKGIYVWRDTDPYRGLQTSVFEDLADGTRIQVAGDFQLWLAPKDGMITIFMNQWRVSYPDPQTREQVAKIVETLQGAQAAQSYRGGKLQDQQDTGWEEYYENEYLIERDTLTLVDPTVKNESDLDPSGRIEITILTYRDAALARGEMRRRQAGYLIAPHDAILTVGKSVILIEDRSARQQTKVKSLVAQLQGLVK